jgi:hypothetical protein
MGNDTVRQAFVSKVTMAGIPWTKSILELTDGAPAKQAAETLRGNAPDLR